jgi:phage baseplate assembly protein W
MKIGRKYFTPRLPLVRGKSFDYDYIDKTSELVKQNIKNLLLTIPGERVMDPDFGIGVMTFLFEETSLVKREIKERIRNQLQKYMPYVSLKEVQVGEIDDNSLFIKIAYEVPDLGQQDVITIDSQTGYTTGGPNFVV